MNIQVNSILSVELAVVHRMSAVVHRMSAVVHRMSAVVHRMSAVVHRMSAVVHRMSAVPASDCHFCHYLNICSGSFI